MVLVARRCRLILALFSLVVETKGQLLHLTETILHIYIYRLAVGGQRSVIQAKHIFRQRIAVVGLEHHSIIHLQRSLAVRLEITYRIASVSKLTASLSVPFLSFGLCVSGCFILLNSTSALVSNLC